MVSWAVSLHLLHVVSPLTLKNGDDWLQFLDEYSHRLLLPFKTLNEVVVPKVSGAKSV